MLLSTCSYIPLEIPLSLGIPAKRFFPGEQLYGAESYAPRDFCPYAKAVLNYVSTCTPQTEPIYLAVAGSCDAMRRVADLVRMYWNHVKVFFVDVPRTNSEDSIAYYAEVLREFARDLSLGKPRESGSFHAPFFVPTYNPGTLPDNALEASLMGTIEAMNNIRRRAHLAFLTARGKSSGKPWTLAFEYILAINESLGSAGPGVFEFSKTGEATVQAATSMIQNPTGHSIQNPAQNCVGTSPQDCAPNHFEQELRPSVVITGSMCLDKSIIAAVEEAGFTIQALDCCAGGRSVDFQVPVDAGCRDPFYALAKGYLNKPPCPRMFCIEKRFAYLDEIIASPNPPGEIPSGRADEVTRDATHSSRVICDGITRAPDGIIYFVPKFCDQGYYDYVQVKRHFAGKRVRILLLEGEFGAGNSAQIKTRLAAFREMLETSSGRVGASLHERQDTGEKSRRTKNGDETCSPQVSAWESRNIARKAEYKGRSSV